MATGEFVENTVEYANRIKDMFRITNATKYSSFQYRLLQRGLVTNINLSALNLAPSQNCTFS